MRGAIIMEGKAADPDAYLEQVTKSFSLFSLPLGIVQVRGVFKLYTITYIRGHKPSIVSLYHILNIDNRGSWR